MNMHTSRNPILVVGVSLSLIASVYGGQRMPSSTFLSVQQRSAFLVSNPDVAKELGLTSAQQQIVNHAFKSYEVMSERLSSQKDPQVKDSQANDQALANAYLKALNITQKETLLRLGIQQIGSEALLDRGIDSRIGLTESQSTRITSIFQTYYKREEDVSAMIGEAIAAVPEPKHDQDRPAYEKKLQDIQDSYEGERQRLKREKLSANRQIFALMTPAQRNKWMKLTAVPLKSTK